VVLLVRLLLGFVGNEFEGMLGSLSLSLSVSLSLVLELRGDSCLGLCIGFSGVGSCFSTLFLVSVCTTCFGSTAAVLLFLSIGFTSHFKWISSLRSRSSF
jgi:hypothetical protein